MPRLPVKKIRKQLKLLLLLALLTVAVGFTYLHVSLLRHGRALRLPFAARDGERLAEVTDGSRRPAAAPARQRKAEESSESREEEQGDGQDSEDWFSRGRQSTRHPKLNLTKQALPWKDQYKGRANLHVFEDWCGGAVRHLRKNLHFPLFPHARTTVKKLAVAPKWKNYGLRIFGYIHPFKDGDFQFSVASDDNSEFWLSSDESPSNSRLAAFVGKLGTEWTAPGEFTKFSSQVSKPLHLMSSRRYYFELLHKQDDRGSDHVEVGWRVFLPSLKFEVIDSSYISLYTDESSLKMNHVEHIPQSLASHSGSHLWEAQRDEHSADMLRADPRDTFFLTPAIEASRVEKVLAPCAYSPTYVVKDFPIARYQGLQFVYLSFVYPNDFTRLTHMETENKCFYRESPLYLEKFGFYKYMKMDEEEEEDPRQRAFLFLSSDSFLDEEEEEEEGIDSPEPTEPAPTTKERSLGLLPGAQSREMPPAAGDYGDDLDYDSLGAQQGRARAGASPALQPGRWSGSRRAGTSTGATTATRASLGAAEEAGPALERRPGRALTWAPQAPGAGGGEQPGLLASPRQDPQLSRPVSGGRAGAAAPRQDGAAGRARERVYVTRLRPGTRKVPARQPAFPSIFLYPSPPRKGRLGSRTLRGRPVPSNKLRTGPARRAPWLLSAVPKQKSTAKRRSAGRGEGLYGREAPREQRRALPGLLVPGAGGLFSKEAREDATGSPGRMTAPTDSSPSEAALVGGTRMTSFLKVSEATASQQEGRQGPRKDQEEEEEEEEVSDYSYETAELPQSWLEDSINWQRTFSVGSVDFELLRSDWNDLRCNVSGNLQLGESEVVDVVAQYLEKLNDRNGGIYTLLRIINVEKRRDTARGNRYLLELELAERGQRTVRLSEYVYVLLHQGKQDDSTEANPEGPVLAATEPQPSAWSVLYGKPVLCQPSHLSWRQDVMVHFVVPGTRGGAASFPPLCLPCAAPRGCPAALARRGTSPGRAALAGPAPHSGRLGSAGRARAMPRLPGLVRAGSARAGHAGALGAPQQPCEAPVLVPGSEEPGALGAAVHLGHGRPLRRHQGRQLQRHPRGLRQRRHGCRDGPAGGPTAPVPVPASHGELRALVWAAGRRGRRRGRAQHRVPVRPAHPLPHQHPGQHPQALRGGQAGLRAHRHAPRLRQLPPRAQRLLGGERLRPLRHLQVGLRPRRRDEHGGVQRPLGRGGLGAAGQGPAERPGGGALAAQELLPLLPLQTRHVERPQPEGPPGLAAGAATGLGALGLVISGAPFQPRPLRGAAGASCPAP